MANFKQRAEGIARQLNKIPRSNSGKKISYLSTRGTVSPRPDMRALLGFSNTTPLGDSEEIHEAARGAKDRTRGTKVKNYRGGSTDKLKKQLKGYQKANKALLSTDTVTEKTYDIRENNKKHIKAIKKELSRRAAGGSVGG